MIALLFLTVGITNAGVTFAADVQVKLPDEIILGRTDESYTGKPYYIFQKIPYAKPPVGELRFKPPVPSEKWEGVLNTTYLDKICYQLSTDLPEESEDCLYLNVYTPTLLVKDNDAAMPVYVYIHGGGFIAGSAMTNEYGPEYLIDYDIIVVTLNYRLGPLGFLSTQDTVIPGNMGLKDQQLALKWVQSNIHLFGGDPKKVTIGGQSAGAAAVSLHVLNKKSEGLFRAAMMQSGTSINPTAIQREPRGFAFDFASLFNTTFNEIDDPDELLKFLLSLPATDLDEMSAQTSGWLPVIEVENDDAIITNKMYGIIKTGDFLQVPIFMGLNSEESLWEAVDLESFKTKMEQYDDKVELLVPIDVSILLNNTELKSFGKVIKKMYVDNETFVDHLGAGVRYESDNALNRGIIKCAEMKSTFVDVYLYQFSYDGNMGNVNVSIEGADGVAHGEELLYIWRATNVGYDNSNISRFSSEDVLTQHRMLTLWTNFVKTMNPTPEPDELLQNITWPTVNTGQSEDLFYIDIGENLEIKNHPKEETYRKWLELYAMLGYEDFDTF